jgi:hypothetical protein
MDDDDLVIVMFEQDLNRIENINLLTVEDITRVCNNTRRPGGMVLDEDGDLVVNRGYQMSLVLKKRLKQFWFFIWYAYMTQREPDFATGDGVPDLA